MKERPILFSGEMVRAILEGRKTQTRRVINLSKLVCLEPDDPRDTENVLMACPYGRPGDRLWVREAFRVETDGDEQFITFVADGKTLHDPQISEKWTHMQAVVYGDTVNGPYARPSIHMPRFASRITLEVIGVRVERVQDITGRDAWAEGVIEKFDSRYSDVTTIHRFRTLWEKINGKKHPWASNPWLWVVEFDVLKEGL